MLVVMQQKPETGVAAVVRQPGERDGDGTDGTQISLNWLDYILR